MVKWYIQYKVSELEEKLESAPRTALLRTMLHVSHWAPSTSLHSPKICLNCPSNFFLLSVLSSKAISHCVLNNMSHFCAFSLHPSLILSIFSLSPLPALTYSNLESVYHLHFKSSAKSTLNSPALPKLSSLLLSQCRQWCSYNFTGSSLLSSIQLCSLSLVLLLFSWSVLSPSQTLCPSLNIKK